MAPLVNLANLRSLFNEGEYDKLSEQFLTVLYSLQAKIENHDMGFYQEFVDLFLAFFPKEEYKIKPNYGLLFISKSMILSNLVAVTSHKTTDAALEKLLEDKKDILKILILYSHRNKTVVDLEELFEKEPHLTSCWFAIMLGFGRDIRITEHSHNKLLSFIRPDILSKYFVLPLKSEREFINENFFSSINYIDPENDEELKRIINKAICDHGFYKNINKPDEYDFNKIAVISPSFYKSHSTYKALAPLIYELKDDYHLILVNTVKNARTTENIDRELFDEVIYLNDTDNPLVLPSEESVQQLVDQKCGMFIYPDPGLEMTTTVLANHRLAPIQITGYGNPASTYSDYMDYFIASEDIEKGQGSLSEKLAFISGLAMVPVLKDYVPKAIEKQSEEIVISCIWGNTKFHYPHLLNLKEIALNSNKKIKFSFLALHNSHFLELPFRDELSSVLPEDSIETVFDRLPYNEYMNHINVSDFVLGSYPFGGYHSIIDALICNKPVIVLEGGASCSRLAPALLRFVGLEEFIAYSDDEFIEKTLKISEDNDYRKNIAQKLQDIDLSGKFGGKETEESFKKVIKDIIF